MDFRPMKLKDIKKVRELELSCIKEYFSETIENKWEDLPQEWKDESLAPVAKRLSEKLGKEVKFVSDYNVTGEAATKAVADMNSAIR